MPSTGQICEVSGIYCSECRCQTEIALSKNERFPPCPKHGLINWRLIRRTWN